MHKKVYINSIGIHLPGEPVSNDEMEDYLGKVNGQTSRLKTKILANNGIKTRHYNIDKTQKTISSNANMTAKAVMTALQKVGQDINKVDFLAAATTQGDLPVPGFANMVHGELKSKPLELASYNGVCVSGIQALKGAYLQIQSGEKSNAVSCAGEFPSRLFKASRYESQDNKSLSFDTEF